MSEQRISNNRVVSFTFTITDANGATLEQTDMPMDYVHGSRQMFPKVEAELEGKQVGDEVSVELGPEDAFGEHNPELVFVDAMDNVPPQFRFVGARPVFTNDRGEQMEFVITEIKDGQITADGNHPYAGKTITFHIRVEGIREASAAELGVPFGEPPGGTLQ